MPTPRVLLDQLISDVGFTLRSLARAPAFSATVIATLAVGISVAVAMFILTAHVLFYPSPYPNGHELHAIGYRDPQSAWVPNRFAFHYDAYRQQTDVFTEYAVRSWERANVVIGDEPAVADIAHVTGDTFRTLGIRPVLGRGFSPEEIAAGANDVVVISDYFWRRHFNADPNVLGRTALINQRSFTIIGVLGADQAFPDGFKGDVYRLLVAKFVPERFFEFGVQIIGRLRPGVTPRHAAEFLDQVTLPTVPLWAAEWMKPQRTVVRPLNVAYKDHSWIMFAGGVPLYGIACVNAMNLMLVRLFGRERELSIRLAVGGSRGQIARLVLIESLGLSAVACGVGMVVTRWLLPPLMAYLNDDPRAGYVTYLDAKQAAFIVGAALLASVVVALVPVLRVSAGSIQAGLKSSGSATGESRNMARVRSTMVVVQAALAVILLAGTGLMMRTFQRLYQVDLGFDPAGKVKVWVGHPKGQEKPPAQRLEYFENLRQAVALVPGVRSAAYGQDSLVIGAFYGTANLLMKDGTYRPIGATFVSPGYLKTAGITLLRGEMYSGKRGPAEAVINETMARERWPNEDPIGQYFSIQIAPQVKYRVIGIARDVRYSAKAAPAMHYYVPDWMYPPNTSSLLLQMERDPPKEFTGLLRRVIYKFDPTAIALNVATVHESVGSAMAAERYVYVILRWLSAIALAMAVVGVFSVVAYSVHARTREFGVRMALGAQPGNVLRLVLRRGVTTVALGLALGILGAMGLTQFMKAMLFETTPYDPSVHLLVSAVLLLAAIVACLLPARRAAKIDPIVALRSE